MKEAEAVDVTVVTEDHIVGWLKTRTFVDGELRSKKSWNNLLGDVAPAFAYFLDKGWCASDPCIGISRYDKRALGSKQRLIAASEDSC